MEGGQLATDPESLGEMMERHNIFGRVAPHQKRDMIAALRRRGHVVAMVGDGINDVLALKDADLGMGYRQPDRGPHAVSPSLCCSMIASPHYLASSPKAAA